MLPPDYKRTMPVDRVVILRGCGDAGGYVLTPEGKLEPIEPFPRDVADAMTILRAAVAGKKVDARVLANATQLVDTALTEVTA